MALLSDVVDAFGRARQSVDSRLRVREIGTVEEVDAGVVVARGLPQVTSEELVTFAGGAHGLVVELQPGRVSIAMLDDDALVRPGSMVWRTGRVVDAPVGQSLIGRIVDPLGRPLDDAGPIASATRRPIERPAPPIIARAPVTRPLHTGLTVVDAMVPIGRGQRQLVLGDPGTGKTALAVDAILHQAGGDVVCVLCSVGQRTSSMARAVQQLQAGGAMSYSVVVVAESESAPGLRFIAPYTAMTIAEWFAERGQDVLIVFDDLTQHAQSYRELALLLRRPAGREAYPGDIFFVHSRLLERATQLREDLGGGSITALPIVETEAEDLAAYIPTNIVSITDGQIYLSPQFAQKGLMPAVDVGRSVSRVGGKSQLPTYRAVSGKLKLAYAQFEELEQFARFGTRMDEETRRSLEHGRRVRELLRQPQFDTVRPAVQLFMLLLVTERLLADVALADVRATAHAVATAAAVRHPEVVARIERGEKFDDEELAWLRFELAELLEEQQ